MSRFLHAVWPLVAVVSLTVLLVLQIPRKALSFRPGTPVRTVPFASFVEYDAASYDALMRKVRMSWQVRAQGIDPRAGNHVEALGGDDEPPLPGRLGLPKGFFAVRGGAGAESPAAQKDPLLPPSVADAAPPRPVLSAPDDADVARALREELLTLPESLQEQEQEFNP